MGASVYHAYTSPVADGTATSVVRPSDWNSIHLVSGIPDGVSIQGNTAGTPALISSGTVYLAGGNNITLSQNGQSVTISGANAGGAQTGISGIADGNGNTATSGTVVFSNSNGVSFGVSGQTVTASYTVPSTAGLLSAVNLSAGATSGNLSAVTFSNSGGVSFGLSGSTITATVATNYQSQGAYLTTADLSQNSSLYAGTNGAITGGSITVNTSGVSVALPAYLTTAMQSNAVTLSNIKVSAGASSADLSALTFSNSNGLAFGLSAGTVTGSYSVPTVTNSSWTVSDAATSGTVARLAFTNANGLTLSLSTGAGGSHTVVGSYTVPLTAGLISDINVSAGTTSGNLSALTFSNGSGVSFGLNASTITASVAAQSNQTEGWYATGNTTQNTTATFDARSMTLAGYGIVTVGYSNGSIQISAIGDGRACPGELQRRDHVEQPCLGGILELEQCQFWPERGHRHRLLRPERQR